MRVAFGELSDGRAVVPVRGAVESELGVTLLMSAFLSGARQLGAKIVSVFPENSELGEPTIQGAVTLLDARTGRPRALIDGTTLTELRTAAGSALATELLADPQADVLTVFGAGAQGRSHIEILAATRALREIRIIERPGVSAEPLVDVLKADLSQLSGPDGMATPRVRSMERPSDALRGATIVVTATTSSTPVFAASDLSQGAHVNAIGVFQPDKREVPPEVVTRARVVVDQREAALEEAGDLIMPIEDGLAGPDLISAELGEIVNGNAAPGRAGAPYTLFKSVGSAAQDVAIAAAAVSLSAEKGLGTDVDF